MQWCRWRQLDFQRISRSLLKSMSCSLLAMTLPKVLVFYYLTVYCCCCSCAVVVVVVVVVVVFVVVVRACVRLFMCSLVTSLPHSQL